MEERSGWRGAFEKAWGNLTGVNDDRNLLVIRWLFFVVFLAGTAWAVWNYIERPKLAEPGSFFPTLPSNQAENDKISLDAMIQSVRGTSSMRRNSQELVNRMEARLVKYPFGEPGEEVIVVDEQVSVELPVAPPPPPPGITLRGIMIMGKENGAGMDIQGVGSGMLVRAGDTFMQRQGRVVRIAPDKVVVNWGGRNWDIAPSF